MKTCLKWVSIFLLITCVVSGCNKKRNEQTFTSNSGINFVDRELIRWERELKKPVFVIDLTKIANPFRTPGFSKLTLESSNISLRLVGIIKTKKGLEALLEDTNGIGYLVRPNDEIKGMKVVKVTPNYIILSQKINTFYGKKKVIYKKLSLIKE